MSQAVTPAAPAKRRTGKATKWFVRVGLTAFAGIAAVLLGLLLTLMFGGVHGIEFCPQTFERRSYSFYEIPWIGVQVRGVRHVDLTGEVEKHLVKQSLVPIAAKAPQRNWHIVHGWRGASSRETGDAAILMNYLDAQDAEEKLVWLDWSEKNPKLATVLWPAIARLSRDDLYVFIPELIALTKHVEDPVQFQQKLNLSLADKLYLVAQRYQQAENHSAAVRYLDEALQINGKRADLRRARAKSLAAQGERNRAAVDLAEAERLQSATSKL